jgi:isopenicillin N synthase-like dioxygenase
MSSSSGIPVIPTLNLHGGDEAKFLADETLRSALQEACQTVGFFKFKNHGISKELIDAAFQDSATFFALPEEAKKTVEVTKDNFTGYTPFESERLDPKGQRRGDTKEGFYIRRPLEEGETPNAIETAQGTRWPDSQLAPAFRPTMERYFNEVLQLARRVVRLIASALELPVDYLDSCFNRPMVTLRVVQYTEEKSVPAEGLLSCGAHSDYGMFTLLLTDSVPGLEVNVRGEWVPIDPEPYVFIVNLGDMLQRWTNDRFKSTVHRVVNRTGQRRMSIPFFVEPRFDVMVECLPTCHGEEGPKYPPIQCGQYLLQRYSATY